MSTVATTQTSQSTTFGCIQTHFKASTTPALEVS